jgi:hypothetical protein
VLVFGLLHGFPLHRFDGTKTGETNTLARSVDPIEVRTYFYVGHSNSGSRSQALRALSNRPTAAYQIDDQHNDGKHQHNVDQTARNVQTETEQPKNQQNYKNCPKHLYYPP